MKGKAKKEFPFIVDRRDVMGVTLLMEAVKRNLLDKARECIAQGSDINATDKTGRTPLMHAIEEGADTGAVFMISQGADVSVARPDGMTALMMACGPAGDPMPEVVERLVRASAPLDAQAEKNGYTALMFAIDNNDAWAAHRLLRAGADFSKLINKSGQTAEAMIGAHFHPEERDQLRSEIEKQRAAAREKAEREMRENIESATVAQRDIPLLKRVSLKPKPQAPGA